MTRSASPRAGIGSRFVEFLASPIADGGAFFAALTLLVLAFVSTGVAVAGPSVKASSAANDAKTWHPPGCPPPASGPKGQSRIKVAGPCAADWTVEADCENEIDDLTFTSRRKTKDGAEMVVYINVERYAGAGHYKAPNDMYVSVMHKNTIYRWSGNDFQATIGPGSKYVTVDDVKLEPELLLVGCTGLQTNYQCDGRGDDPGLRASMTTVSGTLYCKPAAPKKQK